MPFELYEHNAIAYRAACTLLSEDGKAAIVHPTGTGKSFIAFRLAVDNPTKRVVWLSPSEHIYSTQVENLKKAGGEEPQNVKFISYAKLMLMGDGAIAELKPDYIILDEFHRCGAAEWGKSVERLLRAFESAKVLGLSATSIRYLDNQRDMADELFDGNIASELTLGEAIAREILPAPMYVASVYAYQKELEKYQAQVDNITREAVRDEAQRRFDALRRALEKADGVDEIFKRHITERGGKYIVFCSGVAHMAEMVAKAGEWFSKIDEEPNIYAVYAEEPTASKEFVAFKNDDSEHLKLLYCIDMLNEGVHVDGISGVILLRPTVSPIIYKQQIGRALSAGGNNVPIIFDIVNNIDNLSGIGYLVEETRAAFGRIYGTGDGERDVEDIFRIVDEVRDCRALFRELQDCLSVSWEAMFNAAKAYYTKNGNLEVPKRYVTANNLSLGSWIATQRRVRVGKTRGLLDDEQIRRLDGIGMVWENLGDAAFDRAFGVAREYFIEHGNLLVPSRCVYKDFALGNWIGNLRMGRDKLSEDRARRLGEIGMVWNAYDEYRQQAVQHAEEYYREFGNLDIASGYIAEDGFKLGSWLSQTRTRGRESLDEQQLERLDAMGMKWDNRRDEKWELKYREARRYYKEHGDLEVPCRYVTEEGVLLGRWLDKQRKLTHSGDRLRKLLAIGMTFDRDDPWEARYTLARGYYDDNGHLDVPLSYKAEGNIWLGKWIAEQRKAVNGENPPLTDEQIKKLEKIGMKWATITERTWDAHYHAAEVFYREHGHLHMPLSYKDGNGISVSPWLYRQKKLMTKGGLDEDKARRLRAIGVTSAAGRPRKQPACEVTEQISA